MMETNWIAVIIAAVIATALGFVWYSPVAFGNQWMKLIGMTKEKINASKDKMPMIYGTQVVAALVTAYVLSLIVGYAGAADIVSGGTVGFLVWLGFVATTMIAAVLYENKSMSLYYINAGYQLVALVVMGAVLAAM